MPARDLPDVNVWLALTDPDHEHHTRARAYWEREAAHSLGFCRVTMLGLLRLITNRTVMRGNPFTPAQAWRSYQAYLALPEVKFLPEPLGAEAQMAVWSDAPDFPATRLTDAWLAACALCSRSRIVSFDTDFQVFPGIDFLHLTK